LTVFAVELQSLSLYITKGIAMKWEKPSFKEFRLGFEVTMYVMHR